MYPADFNLKSRNLGNNESCGRKAPRCPKSYVAETVGVTRRDRKTNKCLRKHSRKKVMGRTCSPKNLFVI